MSLTLSLNSCLHLEKSPSSEGVRNMENSTCGENRYHNNGELVAMNHSHQQHFITGSHNAWIITNLHELEMGHENYNVHQLLTN